MSQNQNKQTYAHAFGGVAGGQEPKQEFDFGGNEYAYWQEMQQQVLHQQQQQQQQQQLQLQQQQQQQNNFDMKFEPIDPSILTPTIEMDELIIKTEPPDDSGFVNLVDNESSYKMDPFFQSNGPFPHIKDEPSTSQQKSLNFPRRKVQTERAETLPICQRCKQVFLKKSSYIKHVRYSSCSILEYNFKCLICPMSFMSNEELEAHEHVHRANQFFCQKYCGKYFDTLDLCEVHEFSFHDFNTFACNVCNSTFKTRDLFFSHKTQHRHLIRFDCPICRRWFTSPNELRRHRLESPFYCGKFYGETTVQNNDSSFNNGNQTNYSLQDCNIGVMEVIPNNSNSQAIHNQIGMNDRNFLPPCQIKCESVFENRFCAAQPSATEPFFNNSFTTPDFTTFTNASFNDFNNQYPNFEKQHSNNFNFSTPFTPATPAVNEGDAICCVPQCGLQKSTSPNLQFFKFPKDEKYLKQWLHNMKLIYNVEESYEDYRICSLHFPKRVINLHSLCYWAVPTYHLGHDDTANIFHNREQNYTVNPQCSVRGCESRRGQTNLKFYNFPPSDSESYVKWCQNTRLPLKSTESRQLCSRHFEDQCFGKIRLKVWAVPTLHLGGFPRIHDNPSVPMLEEKKCCLPHCRRRRSTDPSLSLYSFPRDEQLLQRWCFNFKLDPMEYRGKFHKVCSAHFVRDVIGSLKLLPGAVPTVNLGHNDSNIYNNELLATPTTPPKYTKSSQSPSSASPSTAVSGETPDTCSLPTCKRNRYADNVTMHTMPGRPEMLEKWCHNLKLNPLKIPKYFRICSIHFEPYCIGGCMRPFAVPTLHLGHDDPNIHENPKVIKKLNIRETCCVPTCRRNRERDKANLHRFPLHNPEILQKWLKNLRRPMPDGTRLFNDAICEKHFEDRCIRSKRLEKWALPTLQLGHEEEIIPLPSPTEIDELYGKPSSSNPVDADGECCVELCKRGPKTDEVKLYSIPKDEVLLEKWSHNLQQDLKETPNARICNLHFESYCIGKRLHSWAIPTFNLPENTEDLHENPKEMKSLKSVELKGYIQRCCLPHCRKTRIDGEVQLFRFPSYSKSMLKKWCHNLQISLAFGSSAHRRLCSTHFEPHVLTKRCPMPNAMPTLNLNCPEGYKVYQNPERLKYAKLRTEKRCVIPSCRKRKEDGVQLFLYPHNRALLRKWAHNTKQKTGDCTRAQLRVCSEHFEENCFGPVRLCPGAIPTLKLGHSDEDIFPNILPPLQEEELRCSINGCGRSRAIDCVKLFKFPCDDEDLLWKWCNNLKLNPIDCRKTRICNLHFESECVGPKGLFRWAIPTLMLGHSDAELQLHANPKPEDRPTAEIVFKCCVQNCGKTRKYDEAQLNSFPKSPELFERWAHNLQLDLDFDEREKYKICNDHFEDICMGKVRLHYGAIPTLKLGHDSTDIFEVDPSELNMSNSNKRQRLVTMNEKNYFDEYDFLDEPMVDAKCCFPDCLASKSMQRDSFDMPKTEDLLELWCDVLKVDKDSLLAETENPKLCGIHFIDVYEATTDEATLLLDSQPELSDELLTLAESYEHCTTSSFIRRVQCSIPECKTNSLSGVKLFPFPSNRELLEKWCFNTGVQLNENPRQSFKVCAHHFEPHCLTESLRLKHWAIPTLELNDMEEKNLFRNPPGEAVERSVMTVQGSKCCVRSCERDRALDNTVRLFNFPNDEELLEKWVHNLEVDRENSPVLKICSVHFERRCITKSGRLQPWAIPTQQLGSSGEIDRFPNPGESLPDGNQSNAALFAGAKAKNSLESMKCIVPSCINNRLQHGVRFFGFPLDMNVRKKWCVHLKIPLASIQTNHHICSDHFEKQCINSTSLYPWAVPTLNLSQPLVSSKNSHSKGPGFGPYLPICCVPNCGRRRTAYNALRTFGFPKDARLLDMWCANLKLNPEAVQGYRVCVHHFQAKVCGKTKLKLGAVPTLELGHNDPVVYGQKEPTQKQPAIKLNDSPVKKNNIIAAAVQSPAGISKLMPKHRNSTEATLIKPVIRCCVTGCRKTTRNPNIRFFAFPKRGNLLLRKWCHNTKQPLKLTRRFICSDHFEKHTIAANGKPRPWAVPTLNLGHTEQKIYENPPSMVDKCCVPGCTAGDNLQLFSFPKRSSMLRKWTHNIKLDAYLVLRHNYKICSIHFEPNCTGPDGLNFGAIPTLHLGHQDDEHNFPNEAEVDGHKFHCDIPGCGRSLAVDGITLFTFPNEAEMLSKWCHNLKLQPEECKDFRICNLHFEAGWVRKCKLLNGAIPTMLLGHNDSDLELNIAQLEPHVGTHIRCCVPQCGKSKPKDDVHMISFPKGRALFIKWTHNLKLKGTQRLIASYRVCSDHFEDDCKMARCVKYGSIPTLNLGHDDPNIYQNNKELLAGKKTNSARNCVISECQTYKMLHMQLFEMPKNEQRLRSWCRHFDIDPSQIATTPRLCALHYMDAYEGTRQHQSNITDDLSKIDGENEDLKTTYTTIKNSQRIRVFLCCVPGCNTKYLTGSPQLIKFPRSAELCAKWCHNTKVQVDPKRRYLYKVCALHFEERCFGNARLRSWAVPTLRLNHNDYVHPNPEEEQSVCCVRNCPSSKEPQADDGTELVNKLWNFPNDETLLQKWCNNLDVNIADSKGLKVCSAHFESYCIGKGLRPWAIPTLNLKRTTKMGKIFKNPEIKDISVSYSSVHSIMCCVPDCRQQRDPEAGIQLFGFPLKKELLDKWMRNLKLENPEECKRYRICNLHFEKQCFAKKRITYWAVPTLRLGHDDVENIFRPPNVGKKKKKHRCCLLHCRKIRHIHNVRLHGFPKDPDVLKKWLSNLKMPPENATKARICSTHFEKCCEFRRELRPWALPTLDLGHDDVIFKNPEPSGKAKIIDDLKRCCVPECGRENVGSDQHAVRLFGFPKDVPLLKKWCENLKFKFQEYRSTKRRVCDAHFEVEAIHQNKLLPYVVPTLRLGQADDAPHRNPEDLPKYTSCYLPQCNIEESPVADLFFDFPKTNEDQLKQWCENLRIDIKIPQNCFHRLCKSHFVPEAITANKLKPGAVPTLNLGHDLPIVHENPEKTLKLTTADMCVVADCEATQADSKLFNFPKKPRNLLKWCANLKLCDPKQCLDYKICQRHFEKLEKFTKWSLPTLNLGHSEQVPYDAATNELLLEVNTEDNCCVSSCPNAEDFANVQLFGFPKITWLLKKWCYNLRIPEKGAEKLQICMEHFEKNCRGVSKLKPWAVPTKQLGHDGHIHQSLKLHKYHAEEKASGEMKFVRADYCAIVSCLKSKLDGVQLFRYPSKSLMVRKWAENCKHNAYQAARYAFRICSEHFEELCFAPDHRLRPGSIPTLNLGHNEIDIHPHEVTPSCVTPSSLSEIDVECSVPNCGRSKKADNVRLFKFPTDEEILQKWCRNLRVVEVEDTKNMRICNMHFEERCFGAKKIRLLMRAVPTLLLGHNHTDIVQNPESFDRPEQIIRCCVPHCSKSKQEDDVMLFGFPRNRKLFEQWTDNLKLELKPSADVWQYYRVCRDHFESFCYGMGRRLLFGAIPTLKLGHNDPNIHEVKRDLLSYSSQEPRKRKKPEEKLDVQCCHPDCNRTSKEQHMYRLPKQQQLLEMWLQSVGAPAVDPSNTDEYKLCIIHFKIAYDENHAKMIQFRKTIAEGVSDLDADLLELDTIYTEISNSTRIRVMQCSVPGCSGNTINGEVKLHTFPYNRDLYEKWCHNTKIEVDESQRYLFKVCSLHFEPYCIIEPSKRLRPWAIPTLNLPPHDDGSPIIPNPDLETLGSRSLGFVGDKLCCIPTCENSKEEANVPSSMLHKFPREVHLFRKWLYNTQLEANDGIYARICSNHFEPACLGKRLRSWSIPTLHLGHDKPNLHQNPPDKIDSSAKSDDFFEEKCKLKSDINDEDEQNSNIEPLEDEVHLKHFLKEDKVKSDNVLYPKEEQNRKNDFKCLRSRDRKKEPNMKRELNISSPDTVDTSDKLEITLMDESNLENDTDMDDTSQGDMDEMVEQRLSRKRRLTEEPEQFRQSADRPFFNFKITAIESISAENLTDGGGSGSLSSASEVTKRTRTLTCYGAESKINTNLHCSIPSCMRKTKDGVQLHMLPKDPELHHKWCHNCKLSPTPNELYTTRVCSYHFEDRCFTRTRRQLTLGSIPTLNLGHNDVDIFENDRKRTGSPTCCAPGCGRRRVEDGARFFRFPTDKRMLANWLFNLKMEYNIARPWKYNVCELHFEEYCFGKAGCLMPWAVPTLKLGKNRVNLHMNEPPDGNDNSIDDDELFVLPESTMPEDEIMADDVSYTKPEYPIECSYNNNLSETVDDSLKCQVPNCGRVQTSDSDVCLFPFPEDQELRDKWFFNTKIYNYDDDDLKAMKICDEHFESSVLRSNGLDSFALPTLKLGHNDGNIFLNVECNTNIYDGTENYYQGMPHIKEEPVDTCPKEDDELLQVHYETEFTNYSEDTNSSMKSLTPTLPTDSVRCFLKHCLRKRKDGVKLFRFPFDLEMKKQWEQNLKLTYDKRMRNRMYLCSMHFEPQYIGKKFLIRSAVPTLNLGHNSPLLYKGPWQRLQTPNTPAMKEIESNELPSPSSSNASRISSNAVSHANEKRPSGSAASPLRCNVPGCENMADVDRKLFNFPKNVVFNKLWQEKTKIRYDPKRHAELVVCSAHFEPSCIGRRGTLSSQSIPSLKLPITKIPSHNSLSAANNSCSVPDCPNKSTHDNVKIFSKFPDDFELFTKWCYNLKIDPRAYVDGAYNICSAHFEPYCIGGHSLRVWAVPTLNLGHNDTNIHQVTRPAEAEIKCCLPHCGRRRSKDGVSFYNFPKGDLYKTWCKILQIDELLYRNTDKKICSAHFTADCFNGLSLKTGVKPSLHLTPKANSTTGCRVASKPDSGSCVVLNCSAKEPAPMLFPFPDNQNLCKKWYHNLKLNFDEQHLDKSNYQICSAHFEPNYIFNCKLHSEAVPTLALGHADTNIFENTGSFTPTINGIISSSSLNLNQRDFPLETDPSDVNTNEEAAF